MSDREHQHRGDRHRVEMADQREQHEAHMSDREHQHDTSVGRIEAASVLLAKEANDLQETLVAATEWSERSRRQRFMRFFIMLSIVVVVGIWLHDEHVLACHVGAPIDGVTQAICNATFPLHDHPEDVSGFGSRIAGFLMYGGALILGLILLLRDPRGSARFSDDGISLQEVLEGDHEHAERREAHLRRIDRSRAIEVLLGSLLSALGLWLALPVKTFDEQSYLAMAAWGPEFIWGLICMGVGGAIAFAAINNLLLWRKRVAVVMLALYALLAFGFGISNVASTSVPIYGGLAIAAAYVVVQLHTACIVPGHSKEG